MLQGLRRIGVGEQDARDLRALLRARHDLRALGGLRVGFCVCGAPGPGSGSCAAVKRMMEVVELAFAMAGEDLRREWRAMGEGGDD